MPSPISNNSCFKARRAAAVVELAVCLPLMMMLFLGAIESCGLIFLNQTLTAASYEGVRKAIQRGATEEQVRERCLSILDARSVPNATISIQPGNFDDVANGIPVSVTITTSSNDVAFLPFSIFGERHPTSTSTMVKE